MTQDRRRRHLIDPNAPAQRPTTGHEMSISTVQKWVLSVLAVSTILHLAAGVMFAAYTVGDRSAGPDIGLVVIAGLFCVVAVAAGRAIHRVPVASPWLLLGVLPVAVALLLP